MKNLNVKSENHAPRKAEKLGFSSTATLELLVERTQQDILCGRGIHILHHLGNLRLHLAVNNYKKEYMIVKRHRKREIVTMIIENLKRSGSRFLKRSRKGENFWVEADDNFAYEKVSHALRGKRTGKTLRNSAPMESTTNYQSHPASIPCLLAEQVLFDTNVQSQIENIALSSLPTNVNMAPGVVPHLVHSSLPPIISEVPYQPMRLPMQFRLQQHYIRQGHSHFMNDTSTRNSTSSKFVSL